MNEWASARNGRGFILAWKLYEALAMTPLSEAYHLHIDGPVLPSALDRFAVQELGFVEDHFPHSMTLETDNVSRPALQLTRVFQSRADREQAHRTYAEARKKAIETGFQGLIQMEFIMSQIRFMPLSERREQMPSAGSLPRFPLKFKSDSNDHENRGFKKHELHLELKKAGVPSFVFEELASSGFATIVGTDEVSFTASGDSNPIRQIWTELKEYLRKLEEMGLASFEGCLTAEATVAHELFGIRLASTPPLVDSLSFK